MYQAYSLHEVKSSLKENRLSLLYLSRSNCSVCHALLPQVEHLLEDYPLVSAVHVNVEPIPEIAGEYFVFTVPVVIVFVDGKEMFRKARFVPIEELNNQLAKLVR